MHVIFMFVSLHLEQNSNQIQLDPLNIYKDHGGGSHGHII